MADTIADLDDEAAIEVAHLSALAALAHSVDAQVMARDAAMQTLVDETARYNRLLAQKQSLIDSLGEWSKNDKCYDRPWDQVTAIKGQLVRLDIELDGFQEHLQYLQVIGQAAQLAVDAAWAAAMKDFIGSSQAELSDALTQAATDIISHSRGLWLAYLDITKPEATLAHPNSPSLLRGASFPAFMRTPANIFGLNDDFFQHIQAPTQ